MLQRSRPGKSSLTASMLSSANLLRSFTPSGQLLQSCWPPLCKGQSPNRQYVVKKMAQAKAMQAEITSLKGSLSTDQVMLLLIKSMSAFQHLVPPCCSVNSYSV